MVQVSSQKHKLGVLKKLLSYLACNPNLSKSSYIWDDCYFGYITKLTQENKKTELGTSQDLPKEKKTQLGTSQNCPKKTKKHNWVHHRIWVQLITTFVYVYCL
jgi:hypothetical protein